MQMIWFGIKRLESHLPIRLYEGMRQIVRKNKPTELQLSKIELLGKNIGLERTEVLAALDSPLGAPGVGGKQRLTLFISIVAVFVIAIISVLLTWLVVDPETFPIPTYVPGSLYGTISPRDFNLAKTPSF